MIRTYKFRKAPSYLIKRSLRLLTEESVSSIEYFIKKCRNSDGGFRGKGDLSDLYYTWFGLELEALAGSRTDHAATWQFLKPFTGKQNLDLVHLTCLIRALRRVEDFIPDTVIPSLIEKIENFRAGNRGYYLNSDSETHSIYAAFLVLSTVTEVKLNIKEYRFVLEGFTDLETPDGGYADTPGASIATTTVTAAAILLKLLFNEPAGNNIEELFSSLYKDGGFLASPKAATPDLLSTAASLMVLKGLNLPLDNIREELYEFIETMWLEDGGFTGSLFDNRSDCEYTYYGLISLGALS